MSPHRLVCVALLTVSCGASGGSGGSGAAGGGAQGGTAGASTGGTSAGGSSTGGGGAAGAGQIGDACSTNAECSAVAGAECFTTIGGGPVPTITFPGGFCSKGCDPNATEKECGDVAGCVSSSVSSGGVSTTLSMCAPPCATNEECRVAEGYHCQIVLAGFGYCSL